MNNQPYVPDDPRYRQGQPPAYNAPPGYDNPNYPPAGSNQIERREEVYDDPQLRLATIRYWTSAIIYFLLTVLEIILILRFVFRLLGANQSNEFIHALYDVSYVFTAPFNGIFGEPAVQAHVFELSTLIAMLIYALIGWGLVSLARVLLGPSLTNRRSTFIERDRRIE
ncbi:YggT family protein [Ktedonosporobacter rubrisoli]|uniref:YggT family protein n=1 Tax=Ktedonosporobacter rubrisoli TaxID=2509675 RepID=A0A4P6JMD0_KTERU|nr:YggT family protein [Ktedonosporobacter rubrisoli]QBD76409.1 YggT family protein [Ktedonosporobacter rubrisoli]